MRWPILAALVLLAAGCVQPTTSPPNSPAAADESSLFAPIPEKPTKLELASHVEFGGGNDVTFRGNYAYVSSGSGMRIIDISNPLNAHEVGSVQCTGSDISIVQTTKGLIVAISHQSSNDKCDQPAASGGLRLVNVTDPTHPIVMGVVPLKFGSHTATPYGDSGLIYNSAYDLANPNNHHRSEIINISDPENPKVESEFMFPQDSASPGCHDILAEPARNRAICAGITETMFWDTTDPVRPKVVATLRNPAITIHHSVATARNGSLLILGDEFAGVLAPGCHPVAGAPTGALWFYDIKNIASPQLSGFFAPPTGEPGRVCSAHNFNVVRGQDIVVSAFYQGGTMLIDFRDAANPKLLSHMQPTGGNAWAAYEHRGVIVAGDLALGANIYVLK